MSLKNKNVQEVISLSYPIVTSTNSIEYNTFGIFSSKEEMVNILKTELKRPDLNLKEVEKMFKVERVIK